MIDLREPDQLATRLAIEAPWLVRLASRLTRDPTEAEAMADFLEAGPLYLRLLGASPRGHAFLGATRKGRTLPLLSNFSRAYPTLKRFYGSGSRSYLLAEAMLDCELRATRTYTLLLEKWAHGGRNRDFYIEALRLPEQG